MTIKQPFSIHSSTPIFDEPTADNNTIVVISAASVNDQGVNHFPRVTQGVNHFARFRRSLAGWVGDRVHVSVCVRPFVHENVRDGVTCALSMLSTHVSVSSTTHTLHRHARNRARTDEHTQQHAHINQPTSQRPGETQKWFTP